ncbi:MAG: hypothetical protein BWY77_00833 [bacterium ADurb.Bin431]|nr:MAG: hypothetical protein BWY77_00833 [bacterium ADurb.Bin431]
MEGRDLGGADFEEQGDFAGAVDAVKTSLAAGAHQQFAVGPGQKGLHLVESGWPDRAPIAIGLDAQQL